MLISVCDVLYLFSLSDDENFKLSFLVVMFTLFVVMNCIDGLYGP